MDKAVNVMGTTEKILYPRGIRVNLSQFILQAVQVFFVGLMIGMERTVLPVLSRDFGVQKDSFMYLMAFVVSFGFVKGILNFAAGRLSERIGRKNVLLLGWVAAIPIPFMILYAPNWGWIVAANVFLGINQGFAWSMTVTSKVDITGAEQRGFATGVNEFAGYAAVGLGGLATGYLTVIYGPRIALSGFTLAVIAIAASIAALFIHETLPWAKAESAEHKEGAYSGLQPRFPRGVSAHPGAWEIFTLVSFRNPTLNALCQAGVVNKIADALLWVLFPVFLHNNRLSLVQIGWVTAIYGLVWGAFQLLTGVLSDWVGRKIPIVAGLWLLGAGVLSVPMVHGIIAWSASSVIMGIGMALLYPNLIASVADISHPDWRSSALGTYRYWRDTGYAIGAIALGLVAQWGDGIEAAFWFTAVILALSGLYVMVRAEETHPRLNPVVPGAA
ncbi:MAG TPA: MFS transporter [Burkholderiales bacterium]|nr:MFS transporter [Burkholderiales bacterium]